MKCLIVMCLALTLLSVFMCAASPVPTTRVLAIGNNAYTHQQKLLNAVNDATSIGDFFIANSYEVMVATNTTRLSLEQAIAAFTASIHTGDTAVVFYSGHGFQVDGVSYLVPIDFNAASPDAGKQQGYSLPHLLHGLIDAGAKVQIIILDACRNNPFQGMRDLQAGWAPQIPAAGTLIAYGTAPGSYSRDGGDVGNNGIFTKALLGRLRTSPALPVGQLMDAVRQDTMRETNGDQIPWVANGLVGSVSFSPLPAQVSGVDAPVSRSGNDYAGQALQRAVSVSGTAAGANTDDQSVAILIEDGLRLAATGAYEPAIRNVSTAMSLHPIGIGFRILGVLFKLMGRGAEALAQFDRAVTADPSDYRALYYICAATPDPQAAIRSCQAAISIAADYIPAHLELAKRFLEARQPTLALGQADAALARSQSNPLAHALRGQALSQLGQQRPAQLEFAKAVEMQTDTSGQEQ